MSNKIQKFFSNDDYAWLRWHMRKLVEHILLDLDHQVKKSDSKQISLLEIGPSSGLLAEEAFPQYTTTVIADKCREFKLDYRTLDIDSESKTDYHGSVEDLEYVLKGKRFDNIVMLGVIEHVKQIWKLPTHLFRSLNPGGRIYISTPFMFKVHGPVPDYWRISEYGFRALFEEYFEIEYLDTWPENELGKNSSPLSINVILNRR